MAISMQAPLATGVRAVRSLRSGIAAAALGVILAGGTGCLLVETSLVASSGYQNARLMEELRAAQHRTQEIEADVASLKSLEHINAEARARFGMVNPPSYMYIQVDPSLKDRR